MSIKDLLYGELYKTFTRAEAEIIAEREKEEREDLEGAEGGLLDGGEGSFGEEEEEVETDEFIRTKGDKLRDLMRLESPTFPLGKMDWFVLLEHVDFSELDSDNKVETILLSAQLALNGYRGDYEDELLVSSITGEEVSSVSSRALLALSKAIASSPDENPSLETTEAAIAFYLSISPITDVEKDPFLNNLIPFLSAIGESRLQVTDSVKVQAFKLPREEVGNLLMYCWVSAVRELTESELLVPMETFIKDTTTVNKGKDDYPLSNLWAGLMSGWGENSDYLDALFYYTEKHYYSIILGMRDCFVRGREVSLNS